jgi:hypothetical protein
MKFSLIIFLSVFIVHNDVGGQSLTGKDVKANNQAFIQGYKDSMIAPDKQVFFIDLALIIDGFRLQVTDTTAKIQSFTFTFDSDCCITEILSAGDKIVPRNDSVVNYSRIAEATLVTLENIRVIKNNVTYKLPGLVYYVAKRKP